MKNKIFKSGLAALLIAGGVLINGGNSSGQGISEKPNLESRVQEKSNKQYKIAFASDRNGDGKYNIYVSNSDGTNLKRLTDRGNNIYPCFSPDGERILFASDKDGGRYRIYMMYADGTEKTQLTDSPKDDTYPRFCPDGNGMVFASTKDGNLEIYFLRLKGMNAEGEPKNLTKNPAYDYQPSLSPDGKEMVFISKRAGDGRYDIYKMKLDQTDSEPVRLTDNPKENYSDPCFSHNGKSIAYTCSFKIDRNKPANYSIGIMNADGSEKRKLTDRGYDKSPSWSPDDEEILYTSITRDKNPKLYFKDPSGKNIRRFYYSRDNKDDGYRDTCPDCSPFLKK
jgi:TolB protein